MSLETTSMKVTIPMIPIAKGRPKFTNRGFTYTPAKTRDAQIVQGLVRKFYGEPPRIELIIEEVK